MIGFPVDQFNVLPIDRTHHDDFRWLLDSLVQSWSWLPSDALKTLSSGKKKKKN